MGYLVQTTRASLLSVGGQDYTASLVSFEVSDSGAYQKGLLTTTGTLTLGQRPGQADIEDYDRNLFKRGTVVTLDIAEPGGASYRHPRGYLYVIGTSYSVEDEQLTVDLGCRLSLAYLTDKADAIIDLVPIPLDPAQRTIENCSASFASAGMVLYQDNQGNLVSRKFFGNDSSAGIESGAWVSVLGETALAVSPLRSDGAIPDVIELSYQVPEGSIADDNLGKVEVSTETSTYFLNYPATVWKRNPQPKPSGTIRFPPTKVTTPSTQPAAAPAACGQTTPPPTPGTSQVRPGGTKSFYLCSDIWTTDRADEYLPATRVSISETTYGGPGGQVSYSEQRDYGPEIEANAGYFADKFAFCVATYGYACNPQGSCPYVGLDTKLLSKTVTYNEYGEEANELVRTIQDSFETILSAYTTDEYRSGNNNGIPQGFNDNLSADMGMYRTTRVITEYYKEDGLNVQLTTTFTSTTSRGVGPTAGTSIDAIDGIKTTSKRESSTTTTLDVRPDSVNSATTSTSEQKTKILLNTNSYVTPPDEAGDYVLEESIPLPLLSEDTAQIEGWVADYERYLVGFTKGNLYGLQIAEAMRPEFVTSWYPGMPFRFADTANDKIFAMRMDACAWGVTQDEAIVVTNGIWLGFSSGSLVAGDNLVGNSRPDMTRPSPGNPPGPGPTPPPAPAPPPVIEDDVVGQSFRFEVNVDLWLKASTVTYFPDGITKPNPSDMDGQVEMALYPYVTGFIVETGGLLETEGNGNIPLEYGGSLVTSDATVVDPDLFA